MEQDVFLVFKGRQMNQSIKHTLSQQLLRCNYGLQELVTLASFNIKHLLAICQRPYTRASIHKLTYDLLFILDILKFYLVKATQNSLSTCMHTHLNLFKLQNKYLKKLGSASIKESHSVFFWGICCRGIDFSNL